MPNNKPSPLQVANYHELRKSLQGPYSFVLSVKGHSIDFMVLDFASGLSYVKVAYDWDSEKIQVWVRQLKSRHYFTNLKIRYIAIFVDSKGRELRREIHEIT